MKVYQFSTDNGYWTVEATNFQRAVKKLSKLLPKQINDAFSIVLVKIEKGIVLKNEVK